LPLEVDGFGREVDVGAALDQRFHRVHLAGRNREDEWCLSEFRIARVCIRARIHQRVDRLDAASSAAK
jgi:hypothetical protein